MQTSKLKTSVSDFTLVHGHYHLKGEVEVGQKRNKTVSTRFATSFIFFLGASSLHAPSCNCQRTYCTGIHFDFGSGSIQVFTSFDLLWYFAWIHCWCSQCLILDFSDLMPPSPTDLELYTITQLIQTLVSVGYELARRFRTQLPQVPPADVTPPFHCTEGCNWCSCACIRTCTTHRRHQCHRHLGF